MYSYCKSFFFKKTAAIETTAVSDCMMVISNIVSRKNPWCSYVLIPILCSGISDLALGILKMLIRNCVRDVLQPADY